MRLSKLVRWVKLTPAAAAPSAKRSGPYGMEVLDCGVPVLSMHAPFEVTA